VFSFFLGGRRLVFEVFFWCFGVLVALVLVLVAMLNPLR